MSRALTGLIEIALGFLNPWIVVVRSAALLGRRSGFNPSSFKCFFSTWVYSGMITLRDNAVRYKNFSSAFRG